MKTTLKRYRKLKILIVKFGALGDVVRTSYFAKYIKEKSEDVEIYWITSFESFNLLRYNPFIDHLTQNFSDLSNINFDLIYSLDDEVEIVEKVNILNTKKLTGAYIENQKLTYTNDVSQWFDMGIISKFGKRKADSLKKHNKKSHSEIFSKIFKTCLPEPNFYIHENYYGWVKNIISNNIFYIGINPFAGVRWPSKSLSNKEYLRLIDLLDRLSSRTNINVCILLFGIDGNHIINENIIKKNNFKNVVAINTKASSLHFAALIDKIGVLITSDSLALHLAAAQGTPFVSFFTATSAAEIDTFGIGSKLISSSKDYCSYKSNASNKEIYAKDLYHCTLELLDLQIE